MGIKDTFEFSSSKYRAHLAIYSDHDLKKKHHQKCMQYFSHCGGVGAGAVAATTTGGLSLLACAYNARQMKVVDSQRSEIEQEMVERGLEVPRRRKRDWAAGTSLAATSAFLGGVVPVGIDHLTGDAVQSATSSGTTLAASAVPHVTQHAVSHASGGVHGILEGAWDTLASQSHLGAQPANVVMPGNPSGGTAAIGIHAIQKLEALAVVNGVDYLGTQVLQRTTSADTDNDSSRDSKPDLLCSACGEQIVSIRWKCLGGCANYNLCDDCYDMVFEFHPKHQFECTILYYDV